MAGLFIAFEGGEGITETDKEKGASSIYARRQSPLSKTLFVTDLDGTLLTSGKRLINGQDEKLNQLINEGLQFTVATARSIQAVNVLLEHIDLNLPAITLGGSLVTWPTTGEHLVARMLSSRTADKLLTLFSKQDISPFVVSIDGGQDRAFYSHATSAPAEWYVNEKKAYGDPRLCWYNHPSELLVTSILSMTTFVKQEALNELTTALLEVENTSVCSMPARQFPGWHEVTVAHPRADKGAALNGLCEALDDEWDRIVVFGDDVNDLPLFARANHAIAVANAAPEVLATANQVIESNDSGAVVDYLAQFFALGSSF